MDCQHKQSKQEPKPFHRIFLENYLYSLLSSIPVGNETPPNNGNVMDFRKIFVRLIGAICLISIATGIEKWPSTMFFIDFIMAAIWIHAEWDWKKNK
jgi:hypothetical protein